MQVTAYKRLTVLDRGVARYYATQYYVLGAPIISLERVNLKSSNFVHEQAMSILTTE